MLRSDLKSSRSLSEILSLLLALSSLSIIPIPLLGIFSLFLGISLLLSGVRILSKYYSEIGIFRNLLRGFALWVANVNRGFIPLSASTLKPFDIFLLLLLILVIHFEANRLGYWSTHYVSDTLSEYLDYVLTIFFSVLLLLIFSIPLYAPASRHRVDDCIDPFLSHNRINPLLDDAEGSFL